VTAPAEPTTTPTRPRAGQVVLYRCPDPITGQDLNGSALVVKAGGDGEPVTVLPLSPYALQVDLAHLQPAKVADVVPAALTEQPATDPAAS
jgi:hypothetical protein